VREARREGKGKPLGIGPIQRTFDAMFQGCFTALVTPFAGDAVDEAAFVRLVRRQIDEGVHGLVPNGTTGESATLSLDEQVRVLALTVETAAGRVPVIGGVGSNDTAKAITLARAAKRLGCDGAMAVTPYYNRPNQAGLERHFLAIADAVEIPLILYNVPTRTAVDLAPETVARLARHPNIVGLKDASNDVARVSRHKRLIDKPFALFSGEDGSAVGFNAMGGVGLISVTANIAPALCARMIQATLVGDFGAAQSLATALSDLTRTLFLEPSPAPAKAALARMGYCSASVRSPLAQVSPETDAAIVRALDGLAGLSAT
jgi:4-hydroxy-tetrahydrodipicolinate synthase